MKTYTQTVREGEYLGPIDWDYNFEQHIDDKERLEKQKEKLKILENNVEKYKATVDGGWPRCGWGTVLKVGMYDGWPYWRPVPSVLISGNYGAEWHSFSMITSIKEAT